MKASIKLTFVIRIMIVRCMLLSISQIQAQTEKFKVKLSVDYIKEMGNQGYLEVTGKFKEDKTYYPANDLPLVIYQQVNEDSIARIGETNTDDKGVAQFVIEPSLLTKGDSALKYEFLVKIEKAERYKKGKKAVKFMDANLKAETVFEDSLNYVVAMLTDAMGDPIKGQKISVMVERLFAPLDVGESSYKTNKKGKVKVPIENPLPGIDGELTFLIELDSKKYGIVRNSFKSNVGIEAENTSTYDKRTMWSPPGKTPIFLLVFANVIIFGIWAVIAIILLNLFKIYKS